MSQTGLKTGDLVLELQDKLALKLKNFVRFLVNATTFEPWEF